MDAVLYVSELVGAMESLRGDTSKIQSKYASSWNYLIGKYSASCKCSRWQDALDAITDVETVAKQWRTELTNLPEDKYVIARELAIIAAGIVAMGVVLASPKINSTIMSKCCNFTRNAAVLKRLPEWLVIGAVNVGLREISVHSWRKVYQGSAEFHKVVLTKDREAYKNDPNAKDKVYLKSLQMLDSWLQEIPSIKAELAKRMNEQKEISNG